MYKVYLLMSLSMKQLTSLSAITLLSHPSILNPIFKNILLACTTQVPFHNPLSNIYTQIDGRWISFRSPFFPNYYMAHLENKILNDTNKPPIYVRYIDDIFVLSKILIRLHNLKTNLKVTPSSNLH